MGSIIISENLSGICQILSGSLALERICQFFMANDSPVIKLKGLKLNIYTEVLLPFDVKRPFKSYLNWPLNSETGTICINKYNAMAIIACTSRHNTLTLSESDHRS